MLREFHRLAYTIGDANRLEGIVTKAKAEGKDTSFLFIRTDNVSFLKVPL